MPWLFYDRLRKTVSLKQKTTVRASNYKT